MSIFEKQDKMADEILKNYRDKVLAIVKATRAGATTSLLKAACQLKQKTTIIAPYISIFDNTINDVQKIVTERRLRIARIPANNGTLKHFARHYNLHNLCYVRSE